MQEKWFKVILVVLQIFFSYFTKTSQVLEHKIGTGNCIFTKFGTERVNGCICFIVGFVNNRNVLKFLNM